MVDSPPGGYLDRVTETLITIGIEALHVLAALVLLLSGRRQPAATLAWLFAIIFLPFIGLACYYLFGARRFQREADRAAQAADRIQEVAGKVSSAVEEQWPDEAGERTRSLVSLGSRVSNRPASPGNAVEMLVDGAATYGAMIRAIGAAKDHIHVLFYIIQPDETGVALRDRLARRAKEGVDVRVLVDGVGSMGLPGDFFDPVIQAGGSAAEFKPVRKFFFRERWRDRIDFRNHRKVVVIDGRIGFTGGINVGREYLGLDPELGKWRDTHVRIEGPAVNSLQKVFAGDWLQATGEVLEEDRYFPAPRDPPPGRCLAQIIDSGPDFVWSPISHIFTHCISLARERIWITNPYFVPGAPMRHALITAALRGIDVRILLPARSDSFLVRWASRSYFEEFLEAGVRIFLYRRGFIHAKTMLVDEWVSTIGSVNLDMRSFYLNFELNAFLYGSEMVGKMATQFREDLRNATEATLEQEQAMRLPARLLSSGARLMSPLL